jgi:hypothetical protein
MSFAATHAVRDLHVSATNLQVIRHLRRKMQPEVLINRALRKTRHEFYRQCIVVHHRNQSLSMFRPAI